jgi:thiaminase/transcriptional activator TenA
MSASTTVVDPVGFDQSQRPPGSLSDRLWAAAAPIYGDILRHPFLTQLSDGTLPQAAFVNYLAQDEHYIHEYARCLCVLAGRAPTFSMMGTIAGQAAALGNDESGLHQQLLEKMGVELSVFQTITPSPTTVAYSSWILAACERQPFLRAVVSLMPCYWIYGRVGRLLQAAGSPDPVYQQWITSYGGDEYGNALQEMLDIMDEVGAGASDDEVAACVDIYRRGAQFEWAFWDGTLRQEAWPVG